MKELGIYTRWQRERERERERERGKSLGGWGLWGQEKTIVMISG
jgi:hypothetical protein